MIIEVNFQLKQLERKSLKKIRASTGFEPVIYFIYTTHHENSNENARCSGTEMGKDR